MKTDKLILAAALLATLPAAALAQNGGGRGMLRADTNGDGMISKAEALAQADQRFDMMDTNKDGVLAADELTGPGARMLQRADTDGSGKVTRAQYETLAMKRFARMDSNGDGTISADELRSAVERLRSARGGGATADPADAVAPAPKPSPSPGQ